MDARLRPRRLVKELDRADEGKMGIGGPDDGNPVIALALRNDRRRGGGGIERRAMFRTAYVDQLAFSGRLERGHTRNLGLSFALPETAQDSGDVLEFHDSPSFRIRLSFRTAASSAPHSRMLRENVIQRRKKMMEVRVPWRSRDRTMPTTDKLAM